VKETAKENMSSTAKRQETRINLRKTQIEEKFKIVRGPKTDEEKILPASVHFTASQSIQLMTSLRTSLIDLLAINELEPFMVSSTGHFRVKRELTKN
jgi:hypothetical protein